MEGGSAGLNVRSGQVKQRSVLTAANIAAQAPQRRKVKGLWSHPQTPEMPIGAIINMQLSVAVGKATWVGPSFFADVEYRDIASEGLLRQGSFKGSVRK